MVGEPIDDRRAEHEVQPPYGRVDRLDRRRIAQDIGANLAKSDAWSAPSFGPRSAV